MATVTKPMALDESFNTTENTSRNVADVLAEGLDAIADAVAPKYATDIEMSSSDTDTVADRIVDLETAVDVSSDISRNTTNVSQFTVNCYTVGKIVVFDALDITTSISMGADEVMLTGLPNPLTNQTFELSGYSDQKSYRVRVDTNGNLKAWHNSSVIPNNISLFGGFSYVTS